MLGLSRMHLHVSGFSEMRKFVESGLGPSLLDCKARMSDMWDIDLDRCRTDPRWRIEHDEGFLAQCREENSSAIREASCARDVGLSYRWKSFATSAVDDVDERYLRVKARATPRVRVVAIYAVGPHHFAGEPDN